MGTIGAQQLEFIKKLEDAFKYYGIQGEDAFYCVVSYYLAHHKIKINDRLTAIENRGLSSLNKCKNNETVIKTLVELVKIDPIGEILPIMYQHFLGRKFRAESGKFFTPKGVASAMAKLLPKLDDAIIMDPTCGGGTFLVEASKVWGKKKCTLVANDIDPTLVDLTDAVLALGTPNNHKKESINENIFEPKNDITKYYGKVDFILANPPFSIKLNSVNFSSDLFSEGYHDTDEVFIDFSYKLLKPDGRLVCLLPHSIVVNKENGELRKIIERDWDFLGTILLPEGVFHLTANTSTRADIVILKKKGTIKATEKVILCNAPSVGVPLNRREGISISDALEEIVCNPDVIKCIGAK